MNARNRPTIAIVCSSQRLLMDLSIACRDASFDVVAVDHSREVLAAQRTLRHHPDAMIVQLRSEENLVDVRAIVSDELYCPCIFLVPSMPPRAARYPGRGWGWWCSNAWRMP